MFQRCGQLRWLRGKRCVSRQKFKKNKFGQRDSSLLYRQWRNKFRNKGLEYKFGVSHDCTEHFTKID